MSLMLRKACQEILDNEGLSQYHAEIGPHRKELQIVTECGQPLVQIWGIRFNKLTPTGNEIEYATELLDAFISTHKKDIIKFITAKKNLGAFKDITKPKYFHTPTVTSISFPNKKTHTTYVELVTSKTKKSKFVVHHSIADTKNLTSLKTLTEDTSKLKEAKAFLKNTAEKRKLVKVYEEARTKMANCKI